MPAQHHQPVVQTQLLGAHSDAAQRPAAQLSGWQRAGAWLSAAPDLVTVTVFGFSIAPILCLLIGQFRPMLVLPLACAGAVTVLVVYCRSGFPLVQPVPRRYVLSAAAALVLAVLWAIANQFFYAQDVFAIRDPATYNLTGRWLMDHPSALINTHLSVFGDISGLEPGSAGFGYTKTAGVLYPQGNHLLPALLAVAGWVFGIGGLLRANVVITALALLAAYGLARRLVGPFWGVVAVAALSVSMPVIFVGRDAYTESLSMLFILGGLSLLHKAFRDWRYRDFVLAGAVTGLSAAVRIDSYVAVIALELSLAVVLMLQPAQRRVQAGRRVLALLAAASCTLLLGWLDVTLLASGYYHDQRSHIVVLVKLMIALAVLLPPMVLLAWRCAIADRCAAWSVRLWLARFFIAGMLATVALLVSRPHWLQTVGAYNGSVAVLQRQQGLVVDGARLYNEYTLTWLSYYVGWPLLMFALLGYVALIRRAVLRVHLRLVAPLATGLALSTLYLWSSQITPDQPWASRRYVPVVLPMLLIAAAAFGQLISKKISSKNRMIRVIAVVMVSGLLVGYPFSLSEPAFGIREEVPQLRQVDTVCARLGKNATVLVLDQSAQLSYSQTLRSYCGTYATVSLAKPTPEQVAEVNRAVRSHGRTLYLLGVDAATFAATVGQATPPLSQVDMTRWPSLINAAPHESVQVRIAVYLAVVDGNDRITPIE